MKKENLQKNTGYLEGGLPTDYLAGVNSPIVYEARNTMADWGQFLGSDERQSSKNFDRMACTIYSALNSIEAQINWMIVNKLLPLETMVFLNDNGYIDAKGQINCSDRYTAKLSGNTPSGNLFTNVWNSIRHDGMVPESKWADNPDFTWDTYYSDISQEVKDLGTKFLTYFDVVYEQFPLPITIPNLVYHLKHSPIQVAVATCPPWEADVPVCGAQANHAILLYATTGQSYRIFDSYDPFRKTLLPGYRIYTAMKGIISPKKTQKTPLFYRINNLQYGKTNDDVAVLQKLLNVIEPPTGYYGPLTQNAVFSFQKAYQVASWWQILFVRGRWVGPKTLNKLEEIYNK